MRTDSTAGQTSQSMLRNGPRLFQRRCAWFPVTVCLLGLSIGIVAVPAVMARPVVRGLMATPTAHWAAPAIDGRNYRLHALVAHRPNGAVIDIPAAALDVYNAGMRAWDRTAPASVPAFEPGIPASQRERLHLYYSSDFGWIVVPRRWRIANIAAGVDGNAAIAFVAPGGPARGWLAYTVVPACQGCVWSETNDLAPAAFALVGRAFADIQPPATRLSPQPTHLSHPDACTARFTYRTAPGALPIHALVQLRGRNGVAMSRSLYVGLPAADAGLARTLVAVQRRGPQGPDCGVRQSR